MAKKGTTTGVGVGGSSILVIFILLCLTTFATLSMVSANADLRLTEKTVTAVGEYYAADAVAEENLEKIDTVLYDAIANRITGSAHTRHCAEMIPQLVPGATVEAADGNALLVRYAVPVNENQELVVALRASQIPGIDTMTDQQLDDLIGNPPPRFVLEEWLVVSVGEWEPESGGFNLWGGDEASLFLGDGLPVDD